MERSRLARKGRHRERRNRALAAAGAGLAVVAAAALLIILGPDLIERHGSRAAPKGLSGQASNALASGGPEATTGIVPVEVPSVLGKTLDEAEFVLSTAGFVASASEAETTEAMPGGTVLTQDPSPGTQVDPGSEVVLTYVPKTVLPAPPPRHLVVCIDPGHQARSDLKKEPVGPGSTETKERVKGGATGAVTRIPEYQVVLEISLKLRALLEARGVQVVMTRTSNDVDISNAERAGIANKAGCDLFIRIHSDSALDAAAAGIGTLYPAPNQWTAPIAEKSKQAAQMVQAAVVKATGANDRGVAARTDMTGFNWSRVPVLLVETGFLSNAVEDRLLSSRSYQDKLAAGMAEGVMTFLGE